MKMDLRDLGLGLGFRLQISPLFLAIERGKFLREKSVGLLRNERQRDFGALNLK